MFQLALRYVLSFKSLAKVLAEICKSKIAGETIEFMYIIVQFQVKLIFYVVIHPIKVYTKFQVSRTSISLDNWK